MLLQRAVLHVRRVTATDLVSATDKRSATTTPTMIQGPRSVRVSTSCHYFITHADGSRVDRTFVCLSVSLFVFPRYLKNRCSKDDQT